MGCGQVEETSKALWPYIQGNRTLPCFPKNATPHTPIPPIAFSP